MKGAPAAAPRYVAWWEESSHGTSYTHPGTVGETWAIPFPSLSLSFLRCKVDRGQQWAVNKVTSGKLCEGSIYTHDPAHVLCGKNGHSPANSLPSSGSAPRSRLHRNLLKTQVRFWLPFCSTSCQWLASQYTQNYTWLAPKAFWFLGLMLLPSSASSLLC